MTDTPENDQSQDDSTTDNSQNSQNEQPEVDTQSAKKKLFFAVSCFLLAGVILLVFQILPAKYGIDLTGYGNYVGLIQIYNTEQSQVLLRKTSAQEEQHQIEIAPGEELEFKIYMLEGDPLEYSWKTNQGDIYTEFHGEPKGGHAAILETYEKTTGNEKSGNVTAPFEGTHGWYWRNDNDTPVMVTLDIAGKYSTVGRKKAAFSRK